MDKQQRLVRSLYRRLWRETLQIPPQVSLLHLDLSTVLPSEKDDANGVEDRYTLQAAIQTAFRCPVASTQQPQSDIKDRIQRAMEGMRILYSLDMSSLPTKRSSTDDDDDDDIPLESTNVLKLVGVNPQEWLQEVEWLEPLPELSETSGGYDTRSNDESLVELPVFSLSGPLFPTTDGRQRLPLLSQFSDIPVSGMEIPLKIFEPRYRGMYNDIFSTTSNAGTIRRCFVVPFCHPYQSGQFAKYGWLYEIMQVQDVADQTNGRFHLVCNHLVTKPVQIDSIVNPHDFATRKTYLRARAQVLEEEKSSTTSTTVLKPLDDLLRRLKETHADNSEKTILVGRLLLALAEGSIWPVVQIWILNLQMKILDLQVKISNKIQIQATQALRTQQLTAEMQGSVTEDMILLAQEPHKEELESMLMEISTLVPLLLQDSTQEKQCQRICERIQERLG